MCLPEARLFQSVLEGLRAWVFHHFLRLRKMLGAVSASHRPASLTAEAVTLPELQLVPRPLLSYHWEEPSFSHSRLLPPLLPWGAPPLCPWSLALALL